MGLFLYSVGKLTNLWPNPSSHTAPESPTYLFRTTTKNLQPSLKTHCSKFTSYLTLSAKESSTTNQMLPTEECLSAPTINLWQSAAKAAQLIYSTPRKEGRPIK